MFAEPTTDRRRVAATVWRQRLGAMTPLLGCLLLTPVACTSATTSEFGRSTPSSPADGNAAGWSWANDQSLLLRGGDECFHWLERLGIAHYRLEPTAGMVDPVRVTGPINGIEFISAGQRGVTCDCRMVLALDWSARALAPLGVTAIRHSGAYVYRTTKSGRPSLHARGLAIDVHGVQFGSHLRWVEEDFERGRRGECDPEMPALNRVECQLRALRLFRELITPDDNGDHHDHMHLAISPLR